MSHFIVGVIIPNTIEARQLENHLNKILAKYDENLKVPEYEKKCYCVGYQAEQVGEEAANKAEGTWQDRRDLWNKSDVYMAFSEEKRHVWDDEDITAAWEQFNKQWRADHDGVKWAVARSQSDYQKPSPTCEDCHGSGTVTSTYNPLSKWDWWSIGGRWDGALIEDRVGNSNSPDRMRTHEHIRNVVPLEELVQRAEAGNLFTFYAVITPDGEWHGRGNMGWFGMSSDKMPTESWETLSLDAYRKYAEGHDIVLIDMHI